MEGKVSDLGLNGNIAYCGDRQPFRQCGPD